MPFVSVDDSSAPSGRFIPVGAPAAAGPAPAAAPPPPAKPAPSALDKAINGMLDFAKAGPETAAHMGSSMAAKAAGDLAFIGEGAASLLAPKVGWFGKDSSSALAQKAIEDRRNIQQAMTYQPRTQAGQIASQYNPMALMGRGMGYLGHKANELIAPPGSGLARKTAGSVAEEAIPSATMLLSPTAAEGAGGAMKALARPVMKSALSPTQAMKRSGAADIAADEMLKHGLLAKEKNVGTVQDMSTKLTTALDNVLAKNKDLSVDRFAIRKYLDHATDKFINTIESEDSLAKINDVWGKFIDINHPSLGVSRKIPIQQAQGMKRAEGQLLKDEYGKTGTPEVEARKSIVHGLKEEIEKQLPEVAPINQANSRLLTTLPVLERRVLMEANRNPVGLALKATMDPTGFPAWVGKHSALFQSIIAQMLHQGGSGLKAAAPAAPAAAAGMIQPPPQQRPPQ